MAIQFSCPSCNQPIEIDDEFGGRQVACPYCRGVITAPTESTLNIGHVAGTEPPAGPQGPSVGQVPEVPAPPPPTPGTAWQTTQQPSWSAGGAYPPIPPSQVIAPKRGNLPGILGIVFAVLAILCLVKMLSTAMAHKDDLGIGGKGQVDQVEMQRRLNEMMMHPEKNPWVPKMVGCLMGFMLFWVVSLICSIVGMARRYRSRIPAVIGLVIALSPFLVTCALGLIR